MVASQWEWCWTDPVCVSAAASVGCGIAEFARRLSPRRVERAPDEWGAYARYLVSGVLTSMSAAVALCVGWFLIFPANLLSGFVVVLLGGVAIGWGSDEGIGIVRRIWKATIDRWLPPEAK